ncbi:hypothetical protein PV682_27815 [Streptomyces niveiscabiei]|uniref:hypothetical protein n=1 Tax=Streptomyces niveiscabiei TaxID=164115 RepID=UPI0029A2A4B4|nr:hypothetical protein [Streptomyces niveiscabiei]MDX3385252.1 hypothetical protein [Streptomyces niveiscabiei]
MLRAFRRDPRARRAALTRGVAATALTTSAALLTGLVSVVPAHADEPGDNPTDPFLRTLRISLGAQARQDRCQVGQAAHYGGPEMKTVANTALSGTEADVAAAWKDWWYGTGPLGEAQKRDQAAQDARSTAFRTRQEKLNETNKPYASVNSQGGRDYHAPEFGADILAFAKAEREFAYKVSGDPTPKAGKAALDKAKEVLAAFDTTGDTWATNYKPFAEDALFGIGGGPVTGSANDIASVLRFGGFATKAPEPGSMEERGEVEVLKAAWASCDSANPIDHYRVLSGAVLQAHAEWEAEYASQATQRKDIVAAETAASKEVRVATEAMTEAIRQAWQADQILYFQKYWAANPNSILKPKPAVFTKAAADLAAAKAAAAAQVPIADKAVAAAKAAAEKATAAQTSAWTVADTNKTPRGRGLMYAQRSVQVAKASYAAAQAAAKTALTASNAAKATAADSQALLALAKTQSHALQTEFRKAAALEAAAQAKAAAQAADRQAKEAAANATKAKNAQATAEAAEKTAQAGAAEAKRQRGIAEREKANAVAARADAARERGKAADAERRASAERDAAGVARGAAETAGTTAAQKRAEAEEAEAEAYLARDLAAEAEREKKATESRARALEAAAAAAVGTSAAGEAREAATEARGAADDATAAAGRARSAANDASTAAVNARAAATRAQGAASRSRAAADAAWSAYTTTHAAAATAHAAAADAIDAAAAANRNARSAEAEAKKAQAAAIAARKEATAAQAEALKTAAWAVKTAGFAMATSQAATAARDAANAVTKAADTAISLGAPYQESDVSAAFAVLIGQTSKTLAEQQASAAKAKADEANKAAATAKALADKAAGDAKIAAQAAADAASDAAKALVSVAAARASAAEADKAAAAAKKADANAQRYDEQAGVDAVYAGYAATDAESEAAAADRDATDAERDAASARSSATAAESDAASARSTATKAESDATAAETAAKNADGAAKDADASADRAEAAERKRLEEQRKAAMEAGDTGTDGPKEAGLSAEDEAILLAQCGQKCVDEYREALAAVNKSIIDWVVENGGQILLEVLGVENVKRCFGQGDIESCLWSLVDVGSLVLVAGKLPAVGKAIVRVVSGVTKFFESAQRGRKSLKILKSIIEKARKGEELGECVLDAAELFPGVAARTTFSAKAAGGKKRFCGIKHISPVSRDWCTKKGAHVNLLNGAEVGLQTTHEPGGLMAVALRMKDDKVPTDAEMKATIQAIIDDDMLREDLISKSREAMTIFNQDANNQRYNDNLPPGGKRKPLKFGCATNFAPKLKRLIDALNIITEQKAGRR